MVRVESEDAMEASPGEKEGCPEGGLVEESLRVGLLPKEPREVRSSV